MQARYTFVAKGPREAHVEYEIEVDPGGTLPDWLQNMVGRDLAHQTLPALARPRELALEDGSLRDARPGSSRSHAACSRRAMRAAARWPRAIRFTSFLQ